MITARDLRALRRAATYTARDVAVACCTRISVGGPVLAASLALAAWGKHVLREIDDVTIP